MKEYQKIISSIGISDSVLKCAGGQIDVPLEGVDIPPRWFGFPPALIPIWSKDSRPGYIGIWKHWFIDRTPSFVEMYVAADRITVEIARTSEQFIYFVAMAAIVEHDGITAEVERFLTSVGIGNGDEIEAVAMRYGDDPTGFVHLAPFRKSTPQTCLDIVEKYDGEFPKIKDGVVVSGLRTSSEFEYYPSGELAIDAGCIFLKKGESGRDGFFRCVDEGNLGQAWLILNSRGWSISDARTAIVKLAQAGQDPHFDDLVSAWLSVADPAAGAY